MDVYYSKYEYVSYHLTIQYLTLVANDGHDTSVTTAGKWARSFLTPLLSNTNFLKKTLVLLSNPALCSSSDLKLIDA